MSSTGCSLVSLNQPAVGEAVPPQPIINQLIQGQSTIQIEATTAEGWPTTFESVDKIYRYRATYRAIVPAAGPTYVWEFIYVADPVGDESTLQQLPSGTLKIGREE